MSLGVGIDIFEYTHSKNKYIYDLRGTSRTIGGKFAWYGGLGYDHSSPISGEGYPSNTYSPLIGFMASVHYLPESATHIYTSLSSIFEGDSDRIINLVSGGGSRRISVGEFKKIVENERNRRIEETLNKIKDKNKDKGGKNKNK